MFHTRVGTILVICDLPVFEKWTEVTQSDTKDCVIGNEAIGSQGRIQRQVSCLWQR